MGRRSYLEGEGRGRRRAGPPRAAGPVRRVARAVARRRCVQYKNGGTCGIDRVARLCLSLLFLLSAVGAHTHTVTTLYCHTITITPHVTCVLLLLFNVQLTQHDLWLWRGWGSVRCGSFVAESNGAQTFGARRVASSGLCISIRVLDLTSSPAAAEVARRRAVFSNHARLDPPAILKQGSDQAVAHRNVVRPSAPTPRGQCRQEGARACAGTANPIRGGGGRGDCLGLHGGWRS
jgi:hypothetical protein